METSSTSSVSTSSSLIDQSVSERRHHPDLCYRVPDYVNDDLRQIRIVVGRGKEHT